MPRRPRHPCLSLCLYLGLALAVTAVAKAEPAGNAGPEIEVCFVLDTTGSMAELVDGAKQKLWAIANEIAQLDPRPRVSFCLMAFRDRGDEYVTRLAGLTRDMDGIYADLSALVAAGGGDTPEAVGQALYETLTEVAWSHDDATIRVIYLTGDAPPHTDYPDEPQISDIMTLARRLGIVVNTIQCGQNREARDYWRTISTAGSGRYARIAQSGNVRVRTTPLDQDFAALQAKLAGTMIAWGDDTRRQQIADLQRRLLSADHHIIADRLSFFSRVEKLMEGEGDLLADVAAANVRLEDLSAAQLPDSIRGLSPDERASYIHELAGEREEYLRVVRSLVAERQLLLREIAPDGDESFDRAVITQIKALAAERGFALQ